MSNEYLTIVDKKESYVNVIKRKKGTSISLCFNKEEAKIVRDGLDEWLLYGVGKKNGTKTS